MPTATFEPVPESAWEARQFLRLCLGGNPGWDVELIVLLGSELATNAIVHSRLTFGMSFELKGDCVRVSVDDMSGVLPRSRRAGDTDTGGRGLAMVESGAARWGIERTANGKRTWFEVCR